MTSNDDQFMKLAYRLSRRNKGACWPNPCVGAVVVDASGGGTDQILGLGCTDRGGRPHAEPIALKMAGSAAKGATLYVTLEPCSHHGKTPPCTDAIIQAGIGRLVYGEVDANPQVAGSGLSKLQKAGISVTQASEECRRQNTSGAAGHQKIVAANRPFVQLKIAVGSDGRVKAGTGSPQWVTGERARARGHLLRAKNDAILVGIGTVHADNPSLTCRIPGLEDRSPVKIVVDARLDTPLDSALMQNTIETPVWIICAQEAPPEKKSLLEARNAKVIPTVADAKTGRIDLKQALDKIGQEGITHILVEGGPRIARSFMEQGLIDETWLFRGASAAGEDGLDPLAGLGLQSLTENKANALTIERQIGEDKLEVYRHE